MAFSLGLERSGAFETVAFCEIEPFCRKVLAKHWPEVPQYDDVRTLTAARLAADGIAVDAICGGYPCQPFSLAGERRGEKDDRHLWPQVIRLVKELRPRFFFGENVIGHVSMGLDAVLSDLEAEGYDIRTFVIPACAVNAIHRRDRVWIVADAGSVGSERFGDELAKSCECGQGREVDEANSINLFADALRERQQGSGRTIDEGSSTPSGDWEINRIVDAFRWPSKPAVRGRDDGVSRRLDKNRLRALGNAVVPQIPELIGRAIAKHMGIAA